MRRRAVLAGLGGALAICLLAHAQSPAVPIVGFLSTSSSGPWANRVAAFRSGLAEMGYVEGTTVAIEYRWAEGRYDRLPAMAADLVKRNAIVIAATGGTPSVLAAKSATTSIPVVFTLGNDPVRLGLIESHNRPGGNMTGVSIAFLELAPKLLDVLRELVPKVTQVALLVNADNPMGGVQETSVREAARALGVQVHVARVRTEADWEAAFASLDGLEVGALIVGSDPEFFTRREKLVALSARRRLPTMYFEREFVAAGGLASYGVDVADAYRQVGGYVGRILKGAKPAELPVLQPNRIELVINRGTAKAFGLPLSQALLLRADEVLQ